MSVSVIITDVDENQAIVDPESNAVVFIDTTHARVHQGRVFHAGGIDEALAASAAFELLFQVGVNSVHLRASVTVGGNMRGEFYENPDIISAGTVVPNINRNRTSSKTSTLVLTAAPTLMDDGDLLSTVIVAGGSGGQTPGGQSEPFFEWILAPNTNYLGRLVNITNNAQVIGVANEWYEPNA
jgi:hypothetical protein